MLAEHHGTGALEGQTVVLYLDCDKQIQSVTTAPDWRQQWRAIARNDCPICMGTGTDQIKGNASAPCGACFGLGKVKTDGESASTLWELAEIAHKIIQHQRQRLQQIEPIAHDPQVQQLMANRSNEAVGAHEQNWRDKPGHGAGGQRHTGD